MFPHAGNHNPKASSRVVFTFGACVGCRRYLVVQGGAEGEDNAVPLGERLLEDRLHAEEPR